MSILLSSILQIDRPDQYKLHLACWNGEDEPLDVFVQDREKWNDWNRWRGTRDDFSRDFIFSLIDYYPEKDHWLFGGVFRVVSRNAVRNGLGYQIEVIDEFEPLVGRLKLQLKRPGRAKAVNFENHYAQIVVAELAPAIYSGQIFPGYENIDIPFSELELLIGRDRPDWKAALENTKGVYLITDVGNGRRYVGSAYGSTGIWARWSCYVRTGHGYNDELTRLIREYGKEHARRVLRFSLLEQRPMKADDKAILERENYWKNVLLTRREYGYNKN